MRTIPKQFLSSRKRDKTLIDNIQSEDVCGGCGKLQRLHHQKKEDREALDVIFHL